MKVMGSLSSLNVDLIKGNFEYIAKAVVHRKKV